MANKYLPVEERFWAKVDKRGPDECWPWTGATAGAKSSPRGTISVNGRATVAARASWEIHNGPIREGMCICHHCDNGLCVNPAHLFEGTHADNMRDKVRKGRSADFAGEKHPQAKITAEQVVAIRESSLSIPEIAKLVGISTRTVTNIQLGQRWTNAGGPTRGPLNRSGENAGVVKLKNEQVLEIFHSPKPMSVLAREFGVHRSTIGRIKAGDRWGHLTRAYQEKSDG